jgi:hypothetical protein
MANDSKTKITISIDIELSNDEILAIKHYKTSEDGYLDFQQMGNRWKGVANDLYEKGIINGILSNCSLTYIGQILFDRCDRDKKLESLLNDKI